MKIIQFDCRYCRDSEISKLDVESEALKGAWVQFKNVLPNDNQVELEHKPATVEDVIGVVRQIETNWQKRKQTGVWGKTKTCLRGVCNVMKAHSTLLELLPSESQYASVFCGTLKTLIQVR